MKKLSDKGVLAIPNRPFSNKRLKIIWSKIPPDGDYRKPLTKSELKLLRKAVPGLSYRVVDSLPELSDPRLELFLREYYHMGDSRISTLTWANIFDACKKHVTNHQKIAKKEPKSTDKPLHTNKNEPLSDKAIAVLKLLRNLPPNKALTGPKILDELSKKDVFLDQSTLTKSIIPKLKPFGVKNKPRIGYYIEDK